MWDSRKPTYHPNLSSNKGVSWVFSCTNITSCLSFIHRHFAGGTSMRFQQLQGPSNGNQGAPRASRQCSRTSLNISSASLNNPGTKESQNSRLLAGLVPCFLLAHNKGFEDMKWTEQEVDLNDQQRMWRHRRRYIVAHSVPFGVMATSPCGHVDP